MSTVQELVALLEKTKPPKQLPVYHPKFFAPKYIVDAVTELSGKFHPPPFTSDEWEAIEDAKVLADKRKEQSRMDEVVPNLLIGNKMAAEDTKYLVEQGVRVDAQNKVGHDDNVVDCLYFVLIFVCTFFSWARLVSTLAASTDTLR